MTQISFNIQYLAGKTVVIPGQKTEWIKVDSPLKQNLTKCGEHLGSEFTASLLLWLPLKVSISKGNRKKSWGGLYYRGCITVKYQQAALGVAEKDRWHHRHVSASLYQTLLISEDTDLDPTSSSFIPSKCFIQQCETLTNPYTVSPDQICS